MMLDHDEEKRQKDLANKRFAREEMGELLQLFSSLGITVAVGIAGFFWAGLWLDRHLTAMGWTTHKLPRIAGMLLGVGLTIYWAYLRIARHLDKYDPHNKTTPNPDDQFPPQ